jgi:(S)-sulfolactate dehydrogenase
LLVADIVISEFMDEAAVADLACTYDVFYDASLVDRMEELHLRIADARALIVRNRTEVRESVLETTTRLRCVGRLGVGLDNIDVAACKARGIAVYPATGANDVSVAEYVIATAMILLRGAYSATGDVARGHWPRNHLIGREITGKRLGLVGFGAIARMTATRARPLGMSIGAFDPYLSADDPTWSDTERLDFDTLVATSDVVSLHVPLTDETRNMIGSRAIARMNSGAILINAARGGIVDESALCDALNERRLGGAALDVFAGEPVTMESGRCFAGVPNLILTPHVAGVTEESNVRVSWLIAKKVRQHLESQT